MSVLIGLCDFTFFLCCLPSIGLVERCGEGDICDAIARDCRKDRIDGRRHRDSRKRPRRNGQGANSSVSHLNASTVFTSTSIRCKAHCDRVASGPYTRKQWLRDSSLRRDGAPGRQKAAASDRAQQRLTKAPRKPGRSQTSIVKLSRGYLGRLALKDGFLGGRYGNGPGLHRLWDHPQEVDLQKPVLQARALDLDMVGELEAPFEIPLGNALVDQVTLLLSAPVCCRGSLTCSLSPRSKDQHQ